MSVSRGRTLVVRASDPAGFRAKPNTPGTAGTWGPGGTGGGQSAAGGVSIPRGWPTGVEGLTALPRGSQQKGGAAAFLSRPTLRQPWVPGIWHHPAQERPRLALREERPSPPSGAPRARGGAGGSLFCGSGAPCYQLKVLNLGRAGGQAPLPLAAPSSTCVTSSSFLQWRDEDPRTVCACVHGL